MRWEYLLMKWVWTTNAATRLAHEHLTDESAFWISEFGLAARKLPADVSLTSVLHDLGALGWELAAERAHMTVVTAGQGWPEVGTPVHIVWTFKRELAP